MRYINKQAYSTIDINSIDSLRSNQRLNIKVLDYEEITSCLLLQF